MRSSSVVTSMRQLGTVTATAPPSRTGASPSSRRISTTRPSGIVMPRKLASRSRRRESVAGAAFSARTSITPFAMHPAAVAGDEPRRTIQAVERRLGVRAALEAVRRVRVHPQRARRPAHRARVEVRALEKDARRLLRDRGREAAHDAREGDGLLGVGDHEVLRAELSLDAVERDERLPRLRAPHDDRRQAVGPLRERVEVEGVERLADVPEHVVRRVDGRGDRALADRGEARRHGGGRRADRHALDHARGVARAERGLGHDDGGARFHGRPRLGDGNGRLGVRERRGASRRPPRGRGRGGSCRRAGSR